MLQKIESKQLDFQQLSNIAKSFKESGYFKDVQSQQQAIVKVMAGQEIGIPPFASMTGISIIQGKPVLGANLIATLISNHPSYDYEVLSCDDKGCEIEFFKISNGKGRSVGKASFTEEDAKNAQLLIKENWKKYASDMYFARAISRGARRFCPGIFGGSPAYTPDEIEVDMDEQGYVVQTVKDVTPKQIEELSIMEANALTVKEHYKDLIEATDNNLALQSHFGAAWKELGDMGKLNNFYALTARAELRQLYDKRKKKLQAPAAEESQ